MNLEKFLTLSCADNARIISGEADFSQIPVKGISIQEYPIENFVRPNELVLSTALIVRDDPDMMKQFISDIKNSHAAALLLSFPDDISCLTQEIMNELSADCFPVMIIPWSRPFSSIVEEVTKEIWSTEEELRGRLESLQNQLLRSYLSNQGMDQAAEILAQNLYCNVVITDANHEEKASGIYIRQSHSEESNPSSDTLSIELHTSDRLYGYLHLYDFDPSLALEHNQVLVEQYTITPLTLWFNQEWIVSSVQMQIKDNFVRKLSCNEYASDAEILSNAEDLGFHTECCYRAVMGRFLSRRQLANAIWTVGAIEKKKLSASSSMIKEQVLLAAAKQSLHIMTTYQDFDLIIYLEGDTSDNVTGYLNLLDQYLDRILPDFVCAWGYDMQSSPITALHNNTKNAGIALDTVFHAKLSTLRSCYQTSNSQRLMSLIASIPEAKALSEEILSPVLSYDANHSSELFLTLSCFCQCNGHINETARKLHLHRQSLLYRLEKLEELLSIDFKQHHDFYLLDSCVQIMNWK